MVWYLLHGDILNAARMNLDALSGARFALYRWSHFPVSPLSSGERTALLPLVPR